MASKEQIMKRVGDVINAHATKAENEANVDDAEKWANVALVMARSYALVAGSVARLDDNSTVKNSDE